MSRVHIELSRLLGEKRLKISQVSEETQISRTTLTKLYYSEASGITFRTVATLCSYLNCSPNDLITIEKEEIA